MKKTPIKFFKYTFIILLSVVILCWAPVEFGDEKDFFHGFAIEKPTIKIGLGVNLSNIDIRSSSGMKIYEVNSNYRLVADDVVEVLIKGNRDKLTEKFLIQVAQTRDREDAEKIAEELRAEIDSRVYVRENTEGEISGIYQVEVGDFPTREDALSFIKKLNQIGIKDTWIFREEVTEEESKPLWMLVNDELKSLSDQTILYFIPSHPQSFLSFKGRDYRGIFVLKATHRGIVLINILNLEDYLKAVVPSELSPYTYAELEALKAQAVAARTYAIRNRGRHKDLDFDLDDSPRTQYYKGMRAEHPLSTQAVELTRGEVALYKGRLIDALYTSTCGGMTENVENVFVDGPALPYLRSQECIYESRREWLLRSSRRIQPILMNGNNISPDIAFLSSLQVIGPETNPDFYQQQASFDEAVNWIRNAVSCIGKKDEEFDPEPAPLSFITLGRLFIDGFGWQNRVENLLLEAEKDFILKDFEGLTDGQKNYLAYLVQSGIFLPEKDLDNPQRLLRRNEVAFYLAQVIRSYPDIGMDGIFKGLDNDILDLEQEENDETKQLALSPDFFLFINNGNGPNLASHVYLLGGEELRAFESEGKVRMVEVFYPTPTNILDRSSTFHRWQRRISREALEKRVNRYYPVGELVDIVPQKRGVSKRVIEISIMGKDAQAVARGLRIRRVLGLGETLFVIDREYDQKGRITHFTFLGKGLGHGVGLCQVGAFGMAQAGADYRQILKKYYRGIKISKYY
jgi:stage II sporulation protein D